MLQETLMITLRSFLKTKFGNEISDVLLQRSVIQLDPPPSSPTPYCKKKKVKGYDTGV